MRGKHIPVLSDLRLLGNSIDHNRYESNANFRNT